MPMSAEAVQRAVQCDKVSIFCASCERYWEGRDRGLPVPQCASVSVPGCGSPLAGGTFHDYKGPITQHDRWCFVCGTTATQGVRSAGSEKTFGVCDAHVALVARLIPAEGPAPLLLVGGPLGLVPVEALRRTPPKSALRREMEATQEEWDYEASKRQ